MYVNSLCVLVGFCECTCVCPRWLSICFQRGETWPCICSVAHLHRSCGCSCLLGQSSVKSVSQHLAGFHYSFDYTIICKSSAFWGGSVTLYIFILLEWLSLIHSWFIDSCHRSWPCCSSVHPLSEASCSNSLPSLSKPTFLWRASSCKTGPLCKHWSL